MYASPHKLRSKLTGPVFGFSSDSSDPLINSGLPASRALSTGPARALLGGSPLKGGQLLPMLQIPGTIDQHAGALAAAASSPTRGAQHAQSYCWYCRADQADREEKDKEIGVRNMRNLARKITESNPHVHNKELVQLLNLKKQ